MSNDKDDTVKLRLLTNAKQEFLSYGYAGANIGRIAAVSGISKKTVYKYVPSKEVLFYEVVANVLSGPAANLARANVEMSLLQRLEMYLTQFSAIALSETGIASYRLVLTEAIRFPEVARAYLNSVKENAVIPLSKMLEAYAQRGEIELRDSFLAARVLITMVVGDVLREAVMGVRAAPTDEERSMLIRESIEIFLNGVSRN